MQTRGESSDKSEMEDGHQNITVIKRDHSTALESTIRQRHQGYWPERSPKYLALMLNKLCIMLLRGLNGLNGFTGFTGFTGREICPFILVST